MSNSTNNGGMVGHAYVQANNNQVVVNLPPGQGVLYVNGTSGSGSGTGTVTAEKVGLLSANSQSYSEIPMLKFSHLWTIKHFNLIPTDLERLCSPWFSPPNQKDLWFLKLRLKAFDESNGRDMIN